MTEKYAFLADLIECAIFRRDFGSIYNVKWCFDWIYERWHN